MGYRVFTNLDIEIALEDYWNNLEIVDVTKSAIVTSDIFEEKYGGLVKNYDVFLDDYKRIWIKAIKGNRRLSIELLPEEEVRVTFRINGAVYEEFKDFVSSNKQFKVKELV